MTALPTCSTVWWPPLTFFLNLSEYDYPYIGSMRQNARPFD